MGSEKILQKDYIENLKKRIPKNLVIEGISDKKNICYIARKEQLKYGLKI